VLLYIRKNGFFEKISLKKTEVVTNDGFVNGGLGMGKLVVKI